MLASGCPSLAHELKCDGCGGYVPTLPWVLDMFDKSTMYKRATATEQWGCACLEASEHARTRMLFAVRMRRIEVDYRS